jgi:hypothetical protein
MSMKSLIQLTEECLAMLAMARRLEKLPQAALLSPFNASKRGSCNIVAEQGILDNLRRRFMELVAEEILADIASLSVAWMIA